MPNDVTFTSNRVHFENEVEQARKRAFEIMGGKAETYAKQLCPVKTGNLRNSITHQQIDDDTEVVGTNVSYAPYVELGHHQEPGRYVAAIGRRLVREHVEGKPFIKPAAENHAEEYRTIWETELSKVE